MLLTGNDYVSLPEIDDRGGIKSVGLLSMEKRGLIELYGEGNLINPSVVIDRKNIINSVSSLKSYWIPFYTYKDGDVSVTLKIIAPRLNKGFIYSFSLENNGNSKSDVKIQVDFCLNKVMHTVNESKKFRGDIEAALSTWSGMPLYEIFTDFPFLAMAVLSENPEDWRTDAKSFNFNKTFALYPGDKKECSLFFGFGFEEVAAVTSCREEERWGTEYLYNSLVSFLDSRIEKKNDKRLEETLYRNLFFSYFYSTGLTYDTEECVCVTSRSPRYYVSAAYWDRDSLLWAFPAIVRADSKRAEEIIHYVAGRQRKNIGIHSRYIDGSILEPGFELDELMAPIIAINEYIGMTGNKNILEDRNVRALIELILVRLEEWRTFDGLYETFLQPTDDMRVLPVLCYDNALVYRVFSILSNWDWNGEGKAYSIRSASIKKSINNNFIKEVDGMAQYVWSIDENGGYEIYDEPPGSLVLLPETGVCGFSDVAYINTVNRISDPEYEYSFAYYPFGAIGCPHAPHPWILSMANRIKVFGDKEMLEKVLSAEMDEKIACESIDENTGISTTGEAFATCAGFLAASLFNISEE